MPCCKSSCSVLCPSGCVNGIKGHVVTILTTLLPFLRQQELSEDLFSDTEFALLPPHSNMQRTLPQVADLWLGRTRDDLEAVVAFIHRHRQRQQRLASVFSSCSLAWGCWPRGLLAVHPVIVGQ